MPWAPAGATAGGSRPVHTSSMPPDPNVIFAWPRPHAALTDERRLLVADEGGDRRCTRQRRRLPDDTARVDDARQHAPAGCRRVAASRRSSRPASPPQRPVTAALVWSVTWTAPADSVHASHVSTVPKHRSRSAPPATLASSQASLVIDWLGASDTPCSALAAMQSNTVRRSCQPMPGPDRLARRPVPHDRAGPLVGDPDGDRGRSPSRTVAAASSAAAAIAAASNSTSPGNGVLGGIDRDSMATMSSWSSTRAARIVVVPTSRTRIDSHHGPFRLRCGRLHAGRSQALPEQPAEQPGEQHEREREQGAEPAHLLAADRAGR